MRGHAERFGMPCPPKRIIATGGGSVNRHILGVAANIFGCEVYTVERPGKHCTPSVVFPIFECSAKSLVSVSRMLKCVNGH